MSDYLVSSVVLSFRLPIMLSRSLYLWESQFAVNGTAVHRAVHKATQGSKESDCQPHMIGLAMNTVRDSSATL
jgi:hypothetical protein